MEPFKQFAIPSTQTVNPPPLRNVLYMYCTFMVRNLCILCTAMYAHTAKEILSSAKGINWSDVFTYNW